MNSDDSHMSTLVKIYIPLRPMKVPTITMGLIALIEIKPSDTRTYQENEFRYSQDLSQFSLVYLLF